MRKRDELTHGCMARALDGEMTFVLLCRDASAPGTIRDWIGRRIADGKGQPGDADLIEAEECAAIMEAERPAIREAIAARATTPPDPPPAVPAAAPLDLEQFEGHSPFPWVLGGLNEPRHDVYAPDADELYRIVAATSGNTPAEREANARVIIAFPAMLAEVRTLRAAIRNHRDQRGDDRCWLDDHALYAALGESIPTDATALPPKADFLASCERYYEQRRCPLDRYPPGKMRIAELEAEVDRLTTALAGAEREVRGRIAGEIDKAIEAEVAEWMEQKDTSASRPRDRVILCAAVTRTAGELAARLARGGDDQPSAAPYVPIDEALEKIAKASGYAFDAIADPAEFLGRGGDAPGGGVEGEGSS